ncbi:MAG: hypothetical protein R2745_25685 [Vicinamibacterales bacterium]
MPASSSWRAALILALGLCAAGRPVEAQPAVTDLDGRPLELLRDHGGAGATVLIFTAVDCPISDRYAPAVRRLADAYAAQGVRFWLVYPNAGERPEAARAHASSFLYGLPVALDGRAVLADRAAATVTPEAAVFDRHGRLQYHGRIDDRWVDFGVDRAVPTTNDLADALAAVVAGRPVARASAPAIGCAIVRPQP